MEEIQVFELIWLPKLPDGTLLWEWISFLNAKDEEELKMVKEKNADISPAVDLLYRISASDEVRIRYEMREKAWRDEYARMVYSQEEGLRLGIEQGMLKGIEQGMLKGIEQGMLKGIQQGIEQGIEKGMLKGIQEGIEKHKTDVLKLIEQGLTAEQIRALLSGN